MTPLTQQKTADLLAAEYGVSPAIVKRAGKTAELLDKNPEEKEAVLSNWTNIFFYFFFGFFLVCKKHSPLFFVHVYPISTISKGCKKKLTTNCCCYILFNNKGLFWKNYGLSNEGRL